jgi:hypothetical protein
MNIELKLTIDEIKFIQRNVEIIRPVSIKALNKTQFFTFSIFFDIAKKIETKANSLDCVFGAVSRKKYKMKFKFHEAVVLETFIVGIESVGFDPYNANLKRTISDQLNQKLA